MRPSEEVIACRKCQSRDFQQVVRAHAAAPVVFIVGVDGTIEVDYSAPAQFTLEPATFEHAGYECLRCGGFSTRADGVAEVLAEQ